MRHANPSGTRAAPSTHFKRTTTGLLEGWLLRNSLSPVILADKRVEKRSETEGGRDFCAGHPNTSCALINRVSTGFRGINGDLPAKRGSPPFIPRPIAPQLTAVRDVFFEMRAIPPKNFSRNPSWTIFLVSQLSLMATRSALHYQSTRYANAFRRYSRLPPMKRCRPNTHLYRRSGC